MCNCTRYAVGVGYRSSSAAKVRTFSAQFKMAAFGPLAERRLQLDLSTQKQNLIYNSCTRRIYKTAVGF
jgi:hypothetical protein